MHDYTQTDTAGSFRTNIFFSSLAHRNILMHKISLLEIQIFKQSLNKGWDSRLYSYVIDTITILQEISEIGQPILHINVQKWSKTFKATMYVYSLKTSNIQHWKMQNNLTLTLWTLWPAEHTRWNIRKLLHIHPVNHGYLNQIQC